MPRRSRIATTECIKLPLSQLYATGKLMFGEYTSEFLFGSNGRFTAFLDGDGGWIEIAGSGRKRIEVRELGLIFPTQRMRKKARAFHRRCKLVSRLTKAASELIRQWVKANLDHLPSEKPVRMSCKRYERLLKQGIWYKKHYGRIPKNLSDQVIGTTEIEFWRRTMRKSSSP